MGTIKTGFGTVGHIKLQRQLTGPLAEQVETIRDSVTILARKEFCPYFIWLFILCRLVRFYVVLIRLIL